MRINDLLLESTIKNDPIYESAYRGSRLLAELKLPAEQITKIFQAVADGAAKGENDGSNRTVLGKGADAITSVGQAFDKVKAKISQSGPVSGFDAAFDKMQTQILTAAGGDKGAVGQAITKYQEFAKAHPIMQGAIYAGLIALAGISGAGLGGAALIGGIKLFDRLLQGDKASSAIWKGFKTGAVAYAAGQIGKAMQGDAAAATTAPNTAQPTQYSVAKGDTLSDIAKTNNVSVKDLMAANQNLTNPDALKIGTELNIPSATGDAIYAQGVGTAKDTAAKVASGEYSSVGDALGKQTASGAAQDIASNTDAAQKVSAAASDTATSTSGALPQQYQAEIDSANANPSYTPEYKKAFAKAVQDEFAEMPSTNPETIRASIDAAEDLASDAAGGMYTDAFQKLANTLGSSRAPSESIVSAPAIVEYVDRQATVWTWALNEGLGRPHGGVLITTAGVRKVFETVVNEGPFTDKIKAGAGRVAGAIGGAVKRGVEDATNKITYNKLDLNWRRGEGRDQTGPVDSEVLAAFLRKQGVKDGLLSSVYKSMKIPVAANAAANTSTAANTSANANTVDNTSTAANTSTSANANTVDNTSTAANTRSQGGGKVSGQQSQTPGAIKRRQDRAAQSQSSAQTTASQNTTTTQQTTPSQNTATPQQTANNPLSAAVVTYKDVKSAAQRLERPYRQQLKNYLEKNLAKTSAQSKKSTKPKQKTSNTSSKTTPQTAGLHNNNRMIAETFSIYRKK